MVNWNIVSSKAVRRNIVSHLTRYYPCTVVGSLEKKNHTYRIKLLNDLCLIFKRDGHFMKISF